MCITMKKILLYGAMVLCTVLSVRCSGSPDKGTATNGHTRTAIRVGVFDGHGGAQTCIWETVAAIRLDEDMQVRTFTTADMAGGVLDSLDAVIIPGGGGSRQYLNMGGENRERLLHFVRNGGGAVGICAGAYFFSDTPDYACIGINGLQAIDIEHDNRGHGVAKLTLTAEGKQCFPELANRDTSYIVYYEGPVFVPKTGSAIRSVTFGTMESDVHEEGNAPADMTNGKPFFSVNEYGKGRVFSVIAHPEATPGMMWMVPRMVRWTLGKELKPYKKEVVQPTLFEREILMSIADLKQENECYKTLLYGTVDEKIAALDWLQAHQSWDAKRWVQGTLFDTAPEVRVRGARYIAETHYLHYLRDLQQAVAIEKDPQAKERMTEYLIALRRLLPETDKKTNQ